MKIFCYVIVWFFECVRVSLQSPCVMINEIYSAVECNGTDWIELANLCENPVDLKGYFLRPNADAPLSILGKQRKNCEAVISGRSYMVLNRDDRCSFQFKLQGEIQLLDPSLNVIDVELWEQKRIPAGQSYARIPNGEGPFFPRLPSPGEFNGRTLGEPKRNISKLDDATIQINEISPSENGLGEQQGGWIELYNYGKKAINLTGLRVTNRFDYPGSGFYFQGCETVVGAGEYIVLVQGERCSFDFALGINEQITLWYDRDTSIDSTRYGVQYGTSVIPPGITWGRQSDIVKGNFTSLKATKGKANGKSIPKAELERLIGEYIEASTMLEDDMDNFEDDCYDYVSLQVFDNQDLDRDDGYTGGIDD
eukprot:TRINITY_DN1878_c0_g1_i1.p2 TRINITY_DN1878_c0_g1~~TRINITY_DN1878_c0_g1_i1.p2  ORF type:complete len:366 (-),score=54.51 TRINITY_DN1878_c0_g1_i1:278-1375(-)